MDKKWLKALLPSQIFLDLPMLADSTSSNTNTSLSRVYKWKGLLDFHWINLIVFYSLPFLSKQTEQGSRRLWQSMTVFVYSTETMSLHINTQPVTSRDTNNKAKVVSHRKVKIIFRSVIHCLLLDNTSPQTKPRLGHCSTELRLQWLNEQGVQ